RFAFTTVGDAMSCGVDTDGQMWCWGQDTSGKLGNGAAGNSDAPAAVLGLPGPVSHACAGAQHACAVVAGEAYCWGDNSQDQLGIPGPDLEQAGAAVDLGGASVRQLACGFVHSCALTDAGEVYCWGNNNYEQVTGSPEQASPAPAL